MEIDEVAARLLRQYWPVLLAICVAVPLAAISFITAKQPAVVRHVRAHHHRQRGPAEQRGGGRRGQPGRSPGHGPDRGRASPAVCRGLAHRNLSSFIGQNIAVSGLGSSQVIDLTVTDSSPQVAQKVSKILAAEVVGSINNVGQSGLRAALTANDQEIVRLSQRRAVMARPRPAA